MEDKKYFSGQKLNLRIEHEESKWEVLSVDNTRKMVTCLKLNSLETKVETFAMDRIPHLKVKKEVGFLGAFLFGTFYWTCFMVLALEVYK